MWSVISDQWSDLGCCYTQVILTPFVFAFKFCLCKSSSIYFNAREFFSIKAKSFGLCQPHVCVHWIHIRLEIFNCGWNPPFSGAYLGTPDARYCFLHIVCLERYPCWVIFGWFPKNKKLIFLWSFPCMNRWNSFFPFLLFQMQMNIGPHSCHHLTDFL